MYSVRAMDPGAERRQMMPSAADFGPRTAASCGQGQSSASVSSPRTRKCAANKCWNKVLSQSSPRRAISALVEKLVNKCLPVLDTLVGLHHAACCPAAVHTLAALDPVPTLAIICPLTALPVSSLAHASSCSYCQRALELLIVQVPFAILGKPRSARAGRLTSPQLS